MTTLFLLTFHDGDVYLSRETEQEILDELAEREVDIDEFMTEIPDFVNLTEVAGFLLVRGEVIVPHPVSVVTRWKL